MTIPKTREERAKRAQMIVETFEEAAAVDINRSVAESTTIKKLVFAVPQGNRNYDIVLNTVKEYMK